MNTVKVEKIYNDAVDKNVAATVLYGNAGFVYFEEAHTNKVGKEELENFFAKGVVVVYNGKTYKPVSLTVAEANATVSIITYSGSSATGVELKSADVEVEE